MTSYQQAFQAKTKLKMIYSNYYWYNGVQVILNDNSYCLLVLKKENSNPTKIEEFSGVKVLFS